LAWIGRLELLKVRRIRLKLLYALLSISSKCAVQT